MSEFYDPDEIIADPNAPLVHKLYAAVNIGVRDRGERWSKCANCGSPYQLTEEWDTEEICSMTCWESYRLYVENPDLL
jgi:rubredoxin